MTLGRGLFGFAFVVAAVVATAWLFGEQQRRADRVAASLAAKEALFQALSLMQDAETGQRGYLITGDDRFLEPYDRAKADLQMALDAQNNAVGDSSRQGSASAKLRQQAEDLMAFLEETISLRRHGVDLSAIAADRSIQSKHMMDGLRATVAAMMAEEDRVLGLRRAAASHGALYVETALGACALGTLVLAFWTYHQQQRRLEEVAAGRDQLAETVGLLKEEAKTRRAAESQVRQLQKMEAIGQLTGGVAHDFNNMLALILGSLELAKRRIDRDVASALACIDNAAEGARRAAQLTARLLAFSRQQPLDPQPIDCNKMVGGMSELLRRTIGEHLNVETVLAGGLWRTFADPAQLESAIVNLCVNARDAMPDGGKLTIETSNSYLDDAYAAVNADVTPGQYVVVAVTDTGTGMPPEVVERAFDPFYTTKGVGKGTGLGLSQVYGFVKQSGGHVKIYSEPGHGTTVKVYLPRYIGSGAVSASDIAPTDVPRARDGEIVLVVEDDEGVRHVSSDSLGELGYTVVQVGNPAQALEALTIQPRIDLLFTDIVMPDMNGRRLADRVKELRPQIKVLFTTGYTRNAVVHNGILDPGVAFLPKPFSLQQLAIKVRSVLDEGR